MMNRTTTESDRGAIYYCVPHRQKGPRELALCRRCNRWHQLNYFTGAGRCRWPDTRNPRPETPPDPLNATLVGPSTLPHLA